MWDYLFYATSILFTLLLSHELFIEKKRGKAAAQRPLRNRRSTVRWGLFGFLLFAVLIGVTKLLGNTPLVTVFYRGAVLLMFGATVGWAIQKLFRQRAIE